MSAPCYPSLLVALAVLLAAAGPATAQNAGQPGEPRASKAGAGVAKQRVAKKGAESRKDGAKQGAAAKKKPRDGNYAGPPMAFYVARGEANACGPGCSEWIAADGVIDRGAGGRFRTLIDRLGARKPPVYFHSPGGSVGDAIEIGHIMRARKMTAVVGRTVPEGCESDADRACNALKRSGRQLVGEIDTMRARCASACVYALVGAAVRQVPAGAQLGVHSSRLVVRVKNNAVSLNHPALKQFARERLQAGNARLAAYIHAMGIDKGLLDVVRQTRPDQMHFLSRAEIARYGIDVRKVAEGAWMLDTRPPAPPGVIKVLDDARGGADYRSTFIRLGCESKGQFRVIFGRERAAGDVAFSRPMKAATRGGDFEFGPAVHKLTVGAAKREFEARAARVPFTLLEAAAAGETFEIIESSEQVDKAMPPRVTMLSATGLARSLAVLRQRCSEPATSSAAPTH
jgi:hypothetical protein